MGGGKKRNESQGELAVHRRRCQDQTKATLSNIRDVMLGFSITGKFCRHNFHICRIQGMEKSLYRSQKKDRLKLGTG